MNTETQSARDRLIEWVRNCQSEFNWSAQKAVDHVVKFCRSTVQEALAERKPKEDFIDLVRAYSNEHGMKVAEATRQAANVRPDLYLQYDRQVKTRGRLSLTELSGRIDLAVKEYMRENDIDDYATALRQVLQEHH